MNEATAQYNSAESQILHSVRVVRKGTDTGADDAQILAERLPGLEGEDDVEGVDRVHAIHAEGTKIVAHFAPRRKGPLASPEIEGERPSAANAGLAVFAAVGKFNDTAFKGRSVQGIEEKPNFRRGLNGGCVEQDFIHAIAKIEGKYGLNFAQGLVGGIGQLRASPGVNKPRTQDQCRDFVAVEHERRNIKVPTQGVTDACFAFDRDAGKLQVLHVAIDGARRDLKFLGKAACGYESSRTQELHDTK